MRKMLVLLCAAVAPAFADVVTYTDSQLQPNQFAQVTLSEVEAGATVDLSVRFTGSRASGVWSAYTLRLDAGGGTWKLVKAAGGMESDLLPAKSVPVAAGDSWKVVANAQVVGVYRNGAMLGYVVETAIAAGQPAYETHGAIVVEEFSAGEIKSPAGSPARVSAPR